MLYANMNGERRQPEAKGERAVCPQCDATLLAVLPREKVRHWRHRAGDCDPWSEPEGEWHLAWKERFPEQFREVPLVDSESGVAHRADLYCTAVNGAATTIELQHSPISEAERDEREAFYGKRGRMFWLLHLHNEQQSLRGSTFNLSLQSGMRPIHWRGKTFFKVLWASINSQFIEQWKRSKHHVFLDFNGSIFYLATERACGELAQAMEKGYFAVCRLTTDEFKQAALRSA